MRYIAATLVFVSLLGGTVQADEPDGPTFGKSFLPDAVRFVSASSEDGQTSVLIFDNFTLSTAAGKGELVNARTKSFSVTNEIEAKDAVTVALDIRGFVSTEQNASAAVVVHAGGETTLVDMAKAVSTGATKARKEDDAVYTLARTSADSADFSEVARSKSSENFYARVTTTLAKGQPLQATLVLLVDRLQAAGSQALITIDSIDVSVKPAPVPKAAASAEKNDGKSAGKPESDEAGEKKAVAQKTPAPKNAAAKKKPAAAKAPAAKKDVESVKEPEEKQGAESPGEESSSRKPAAKKKPAKKPPEKAAEEKSAPAEEDMVPEEDASPAEEMAENASND